MKSSKIYAAAFSLALIALGGCGGNSVKTSDSASVARPAVEKELSPDVEWRFLHGDVRLCVSRSHDSENPGNVTVDSVSFYPGGGLKSIKSSVVYDGTLYPTADVLFEQRGENLTQRSYDLSVSPAMEIIVSRDDAGRIVGYERNPNRPGDMVDGTYREDYSWDGSDRLLSYRISGFEGDLLTKYSYGQDGMLSESVTTTQQPGYSSKKTFVYRYLEFDSEGNWTEREARVTDEVSDEGEDMKNIYMLYESRKIEYYPAH